MGAQARGWSDLACGHSLVNPHVEDRLEKNHVEILEDKGRLYFLSLVSVHYEMFSPLYTENIRRLNLFNLQCCSFSRPYLSDFLKI